MANDKLTEKEIEETAERLRAGQKGIENEHVPDRRREYREFIQEVMGIKCDVGTFQKGVDFIKRLVPLYIGCHDESDVNVYVYNLKIEIFGDPYQKQFDLFEFPVSKESINRLIRESTRDRRAFDTLIIFASEKIQDSHFSCQYPELAEFLSEYLSDQLLPDNKKKRPCPPSKRPRKSTHARDVAIAFGIRILEYYRWQASRNITQVIDGTETKLDKCCAEGGTAVDAAGCATNLGFSTIDNIYQQHKDDMLLSPKGVLKIKGRKMC